MRLNILAFAAGVIVLQMQPQLPPASLWTLAGLLLALPAMRWQGAWPGRLLGVLACFALGFAWAGWRAEIRLADALPTAWEGRDVEVVGVVATLPQDFSQGTRFEFAVEKLLTAPDRKYPWGATAVVPQRIMLSWYQGQRDGEEFVRQPLRPGERWQMTVRLKRPHGNSNPNGFDYEAWLLERDIRATGYVRQNPPSAWPKWSGNRSMSSSVCALACVIRLPRCCRRSATPGPAFWWRWWWATSGRFRAICGPPSIAAERRISCRSPAST